MYAQHIILDFEMNPAEKKTGTVAQLLKQKIIEIGAIKLNSNYEIVDQFSSFVKPQYNNDIAKHISRLTGIKFIGRMVEHMIKFLIQLIGGVDNLMYALVMFIVMNCITAILVAIIDKKWLKGKLRLKIIFGKIGIIVPICIANIIDAMTVGNDFTIRTIVIYFYLSKEGIAILDNLEQIGVPFPSIIMKVIEQLNREESSDEKLTADVLSGPHKEK